MDVVKEPGKFLLAQDKGKVYGFFGVGDVFDGPFFFKSDTVEKAQGADGLIHQGPRDLFFFDEIELIGTDMIGSKQTRGFSEELVEMGDPGDLSLAGSVRTVAVFETFAHRCS